MLLGLALSFATAKLATDILKMWAGRLRPDFLSRCRWSSEENRCLGDAQLIIEGRRSFPSGHSSNAFAGFGFLSLWIAGHLGVLSGWGGAYGGGRAWRVILAGMPLFPAAYVAISRTQQYIHNPSDVAFGSALGFGCAVIFFFMYYRTEGVPRDDTPPSVAFGKKDKLEDAPFETVDRVKGPRAVAAGGYEEV
ncbi:hypothetical protein HDV00_005358 [Rhizophlyctis rosea]|nr:hypothetical protein HDV00_005358 [Rhizophlyctis rosea]